MSADLIYLDYAATTPVDGAVVEVMTALMAEGGDFANASAVHTAGRQSRRHVDTAAQQVAALVGVAPEDLTWTSGATESDNLAIQGIAHQRAHRGKHLITMATEHKAVSDTFRALEKQGFEVTWVAPQSNGVLKLEDLAEAIREDTQLVSVMHVNNETGVIQDIEAIGHLCRERGVVYHVDIAQSAGKLPLNLAELPIDLASMTAHKLYGPVGIGALYVARRNGVHPLPMMHGGRQQGGLRPGTLPVALIAGFGAAAAIAADQMTADHAHLTTLRDALYHGIRDVAGLQLNGDLARSYPGLLNVSVADIDGESLLMALEPLLVATGSACNAQDQEPSRVLRAMGCSDQAAQGAIRFSLGRQTTREQIDFAASHYRESVAWLRSLAPEAVA